MSATRDPVAGVGKHDHKSEISTEEFRVRHEIENIFDGPDIVGAQDRNRFAVLIVECTRIIVKIHIHVGKSGRRQNTCIEPNLAGLPLWLLLRHRGLLVDKIGQNMSAVHNKSARLGNSMRPQQPSVGDLDLMYRLRGFNGSVKNVAASMIRVVL